MPHLEGWALTGDMLYVPGVGHHEVQVVDRRTWEVVKRIPVAGQPVFAVARPDTRQIWVTLAFPDNDTVQIIDTRSLQVIKTMKPGKAVLHLEFTPRGEAVWVPVRDQNKIVVYDTESFEAVGAIPAEKPSGVFFTTRAARIGM
jgi:protein NirF